MKKLFLFFVVFVLASAYGILFTKSGNVLVSSYLEKKVNSNPTSNVRLKIGDFTLTPSTINFEATINDESYLKVSGNLELFNRIVDLKYDLKIDDLSTLKSVINQDLTGSFVTSGFFKGNSKEATIDGISNIASSDTKYNINLVDFKIRDIQIGMKDGKIEELLSFANIPSIARGTLNVSGNIKNIDIQNLDGAVYVNISKAQIDNDVLNEQYNQTMLSPINFQGDLNAQLAGKKAEIKSNITSSLADIILEKFIVELDKKKFSGDYKIDAKNLNKLEDIFGIKLNGSFSTNGNLAYDNGFMFVNGLSNLFDSSASYNLEIKDKLLQNFSFKMDNAKVEELLKTLNQPIFSTGTLNVQGNAKTADLSKLDGFVSSKISDAKILKDVVNKNYKQELKENVNYDLTLNTIFEPNQAVSNGKFSSNLLNLNFGNAVYDLKDKSFKSDYLLKIPSLANIKELIKVKLIGEAEIKGEVGKKENVTYANGKSNILGGTLDFDLKDNDLNATLNSISARELAKMLDKPEFFDSNGNLMLSYNTLTKNGTVKGNFLKGSFIPNNFTTIVSQITKTDLSKEVYNEANLNSQIKGEQVISNMLLKSENTQIEIKDSMLDFAKNSIDAKLSSQIKKESVNLSLKGDMNKPSIAFDVKAFKSELIKKVTDKKLKLL